jgi:hypothetical protein
MNTTTMNQPPHRGIELPAAVAISFSLAGGLLLGGAGVAALIYAGRMSAHLMLPASTVLFITGAMLGLAHGVVLGMFGRPVAMTGDRAVGALLHGMLYLLPALLVGWLLAGWIAAMPIATLGGHWLAGSISAMAWLAMLAVLPWAARRGWTAAVLAYRRWDDRVLGTALIGVVLLALAAMFVIEPPTIWFTDITFSRIGGMFFAGFLAFWFYGPMITLALHYAHRLRPDLATLKTPRVAWRRATVSIGIAVAAGLGLALIAVPLFGGPTGLGTGAERLGFGPALLAAMAAAITDELLVRLVALTLVYVIAVRFFHATPVRAVIAAIVAATVLDLALQLPMLRGLGLPGLPMIAAYLAVRIAIPAALFGYLYWRRGLGTAVTAHLTADAALLLLAA